MAAVRKVRLPRLEKVTSSLGSRTYSLIIGAGIAVQLEATVG